MTDRQSTSHFPQAFRQLMIVLAVLSATTYLTYRLLYSINFESTYAIVASAMLLGAEFWGVFLMFLYFMQVWRQIAPEPTPPLKNRSVDVFLPTYNEDVQLLQGSINALNQLDYPHTTYVLDDGHRPDVADLCRQMGVNYISRDNNIHAKAGNLNNALDQTDGEFVVIFDADHIARPNFISRTLGYFADDKLAFVQTPHAFYNFDSFQSHVDFKRGIYWEEGQLFYNVIQPGKTAWNANVFCGSAAIFRRTALEDVGLIATETITEDMHTGLRLHAKGWKSLFVNERMIAAQAAPDITTFAAQRLRWGEGNLSIFAYDNPLTMPGLTLGQRLNYLGSMLGWTTGPAKALLYAAPILMLLTGVSPVGQFTLTLLAVTMAYLIVTWSAVKVVSNGYGRLWDMEVQAMTNFWIQCCCLYRSIINRGRGKFVVTNKRGRQSTKFTMLIAPHVTVITAGIAAIAWAAAKIYFGASNDYVALAVGGLIITVQSLMAFEVVRKAFRPADGRFSWRHPTNEVHIQYDGDGLKGQAISVDVNESGLGAIAYQPIPVGTIVTLNISTATRQLACQAEARSCWQLTEGQPGFQAFRVGFHFLNLTHSQVCDLWSISAEAAVDDQYKRLGPSANRQRRKNVMRLPIELAANEGAPASIHVVSSVLDDESILFDSTSRLELNPETFFRINSPVGTISGTGQLENTERADEYRLRFTKFDNQSRSLLKSLQASERQSKTGSALNPIFSTAPRPLVRPLIHGGWMALAASVMCVLCAWHVWKDNYFLSTVGKNHQPISTEQRDEAQAILAKIMDAPLNKQSPALLFEARRVLELLGEKERLDKLDQILAKDFPDDVGLKLARASELSNHKEFTAAYEAFKEIGAAASAGEIKPSKTQQFQIDVGLARSAMSVKKPEVAVAAYRKALTIKPDTEVSLELANVLFDQKQLAAVRDLLAEMPPSFDAQQIQARLEMAEGKPEAAVALLRKLIEEHPDAHGLRSLFANALEDTGENEQAIAQLQKLIDQGYQLGDTRLRLVNLLMTENKFDQAVPLLDDLSQHIVHDSSFWPSYVNAVRHLKQPSSQMRSNLDAIYEKLTTMKDCEPLKEDLAEYFASDHQLGRATTLMSQCVQDQPENLHLRKRYAEMLHDAGEYVAADEQYRTLLELVDSSETQPVSIRRNPS
ncbi:glycosyltransferase [Blastopirellula marina]|uniref:Cellulose synthase n=1 Tax=Blastopirellula marina TaxID=124 RepID=A0A2S8GNT6_9BACT|nr:glycosyltransferase [Blastopirellula marina]PQO46085.1 cellulose synthase [Blastopirellula marina]